MKKWRKLYAIKATFMCPYCLKDKPWTEATHDHEPPKSRQKELGKSKIYVVCRECNCEKGALTLEEYREWKRLEAIRNGVTEGVTR